MFIFLPNTVFEKKIIKRDRKAKRIYAFHGSKTLILVTCGASEPFYLEMSIKKAYILSPMENMTFKISATLTQQNINQLDL